MPTAVPSQIKANELIKYALSNAVAMPYSESQASFT